MKKLFTLFLSASFCGMFAQPFWSNLNSPTNCNYYAVAHDGSKMFGCNGIIGGIGQLYYKQGAGTWGTVAVTINSLTSVNNINCLMNGDLLMTGSQVTTAVVYRSTNNGSNWTQSTATLTGFNQNIIQDGSGNVYVYNYAGGSTIAKSTDNGATFSTPNATFTAKCLAVSGNTLYAARSGVSTWNIYSSTDGGSTWNLTANNLTLSSQSFVYATPNGNVYIDTQRKSTDGGNTWSNMTAPPNSGFYFVDMANNYYVANDPNNVYKSSDAGTTYTDVLSGLPLSPTISMQRRIPTNDGKLYVSTIGMGTYSLFVHPAGAPSSVSENSKKEDKLNVFPVPADNELNIQVNGGSVKSVQLTDITGRVILTELNIGFINTNSLANGIYILRVSTEQGVLSRRISVSH